GPRPRSRRTTEAEGLGRRDRPGGDAHPVGVHRYLRHRGRRHPALLRLAAGVAARRPFDPRRRRLTSPARRRAAPHASADHDRARPGAEPGAGARRIGRERASPGRRAGPPGRAHRTRPAGYGGLMQIPEDYHLINLLPPEVEAERTRRRIVFGLFGGLALLVIILGFL